ncbi:hypothetical protein V3C99_005959, partial [Haemonchus contortus]
ALLIFCAFCVVRSERTVLTAEQFAAKPISKEAQKLTGKALVDYVNEQQSFFKAEYSPDVIEQRKRTLMKMELLEHPMQKEIVAKAKKLVINEDIPESFDAREKWKECPSIRYIRDQSNCGSCWAVSAAETMSDRLCIHSNGTRKTMISDTDMLSCCGLACGFGCDGGLAIGAWFYAQDFGVCSGGRYEEEGVCKPYVFHPCGFHKGQKYYGQCPKHVYKTPKCKSYCQYGYGKRYQADRVFAKKVYGLYKDEDIIRMDIMKKGPVQTAFEVFEDFYSYKKGVYVHTAGEQNGLHAVKIIGWGVENGTKYWTVANSWNTDWGEDGYFRFLRGVNHCSIEGYVLAGDF